MPAQDLDQDAKAAAHATTERPAFLSETPPRPKFAVGLTAWLDLVRDETVRPSTIVRGWVEGAYFLVDAPFLDGNLIPSVKDESVTVRYVLDGVVYGFTTRFLRKLVEPGTLWILAYPDLLQTRCLRKHARITMPLVATIREAEGPASVHDLSAGGALLEYPEGADDMDVGRELTLAVTLPDGSQVEGLVAAIKNIADAPRTVGVAFQDDDSEPVQSISTYLDTMTRNRSLSDSNGAIDPS